MFAWTLWGCGVAPMEPAQAVAEARLPELGAPAPGPVPPPVADGFDFPVGPPDASGYYDAQPFGRNTHLGADWNAVTGGNTDLGAPVHVVAHGVVTFAADIGGGWGNVVRVRHRYEEEGSLRDVESLYGHLDRVDVAPGEVLERGATVGTIGDAHRNYIAHLHFEVRSVVGLPVGPGYAADSTGYLDPTGFLQAHRPK